MVLLATIVAGGILAAVARRPPGRRAAAPPAAAVQSVALDLAVEASGLTPAATAVPKDHRVVGSIVNRRAATVRVSLTGYEDRFSIPALTPGATARFEFLADRPGEDFAWLVDGEPAGRLIVQGSHLVDGHR